MKKKFLNNKILYLFLLICSLLVMLEGLFLFVESYFRFCFFRSYFDRKFTIIVVMPIVIFTIYCGFSGFLSSVNKKNIHKLFICSFIDLILNIFSDIYNVFNGGKILLNIYFLIPIGVLAILSYILNNHIKNSNVNDRGFKE